MVKFNVTQHDNQKVTDPLLRQLGFMGETVVSMIVADEMNGRVMDTLRRMDGIQIEAEVLPGTAPQAAKDLLEKQLMYVEAQLPKEPKLLLPLLKKEKE